MMTPLASCGNKIRPSNQATLQKLGSCIQHCGCHNCMRRAGDHRLLASQGLQGKVDRFGAVSQCLQHGHAANLAFRGHRKDHGLAGRLRHGKTHLQRLSRCIHIPGLVTFRRAPQFGHSILKLLLLALDGCSLPSSFSFGDGSSNRRLM